MKKLDKYFKSKLLAHQIAPSPKAWERVQEGLERPRRKVKIGAWLAAASVLLLLCVGVFYATQKSSDMPLAVATTPILENQNGNKSIENKSENQYRKSIIEIKTVTEKQNNEFFKNNFQIKTELTVSPVLEKSRTAESNNIAETKTEKAIVLEKINISFSESKNISSRTFLAVSSIEKKAISEIQTLRQPQNNLDLPISSAIDDDDDPTLTEKVLAIVGSKTTQLVEEFKNSETLATIKSMRKN